MAVQSIETEVKTTIPPGKDMHRVYAEMLAISMFVLFIAIAVTWWIGQDSNQIAHRLYHAKLGLDDLRHNVQKLEARTGGAQ